MKIERMLSCRRQVRRASAGKTAAGRRYIQMAEYYLAVDIGASSGRHILGWLEDGKIRIEEIYRFPNGMKEMGGSLCWDVQALFSEIRAGLKLIAEAVGHFEHLLQRCVADGINDYLAFLRTCSKGAYR